MSMCRLNPIRFDVQCCIAQSWSLVYYSGREQDTIMLHWVSWCHQSNLAPWVCVYSAGRRHVGLAGMRYQRWTYSHENRFRICSNLTSEIHTNFMSCCDIMALNYFLLRMWLQYIVAPYMCSALIISRSRWGRSRGWRRWRASRVVKGTDSC